MLEYYLNKDLMASSGKKPRKTTKRKPESKATPIKQQSRSQPKAKNTKNGHPVPQQSVENNIIIQSSQIFLQKPVQAQASCLSHQKESLSPNRYERLFSSSYLNKTTPHSRFGSKQKGTQSNRGFSASKAKDRKQSKKMSSIVVKRKQPIVLAEKSRDTKDWLQAGRQRTPESGSMSKKSKSKSQRLKTQYDQYHPQPLSSMHHFELQKKVIQAMQSLRLPNKQLKSNNGLTRPKGHPLNQGHPYNMRDPYSKQHKDRLSSLRSSSKSAQSRKLPDTKEAPQKSGSYSSMKNNNKSLENKQAQVSLSMKMNPPRIKSPIMHMMGSIVKRPHAYSNKK